MVRFTKKEMLRPFCQNFDSFRSSADLQKGREFLIFSQRTIKIGAIAPGGFWIPPYFATAPFSYLTVSASKTTTVLGGTFTVFL